MEIVSLNAKDYIKNGQNLSEYQCGICYDLCIDPVRCKGPCQQIYCMRCVSQSKNVTNKCPKRCSEPFRVLKVQQFDIQFQCPYSRQCSVALKSLQQFDHHYQICQFISPLQLCKKSSKKQYKCHIGHNLQFYTGNFHEMVSSICNQCKQFKLCRSICRKCDEKYCIQCKNLQCSKKSCPLGHKFEIFQNEQMHYICDICGFNAWCFDDKLFDDKICNFGICKSCHDKLPQQINNSVFNNLKNRQQICECHGQLKIKQQNLIKQCSSCQKTKKCPKSCQKCDKSYCLKCKTICLSQNPSQQYQQYTCFQIQLSSACMNCDVENTTYYKDQSNGLILCQSCKIYFDEITADKQRTRVIQCQKKHHLIFIKNFKAESVCTKCLQHKKTPLICLKCQEFYCLQCKIIQFNSCYYSHPLKACLTVSPQLKCDVCNIQKVDMKECKKCSLSICSECIKQSYQNQASS